MAWARTVAVVVPSPATSDVLEATSRTIWAPMFSRPSCSSISLATVTPSLVMVGEPNFFSITTLRPLGPRVTFTASARILTPRRIACRDCSPCTICFAIIRISYQKLRIFLHATPAFLGAIKQAALLDMPRVCGNGGVRHPQKVLCDYPRDFETIEVLLP